MFPDLKTQAKAIIFDADGTLFNSFELIVSAYKHVSETHNLRVPSPEEIRGQLGNSLPDIFKLFYPNHDIEELLNTNSTFIAANTMKSEAFEGMNELLETLRRNGFKLAILTSGGVRISGILEHHGINHLFTSVVHHERITNPKPHCEGFLLAAKECGIRPDEGVMIGDTVNDILTGKNAGALASIGITHGYGMREDLISAEADYIVDSLSELNELFV